MSDKTIEEMRNDLCEAEKDFAKFCRGRHCQECEYYFAKTDCKNQILAEKLVDKGYRKSDAVALETAYDFQNRLRHIFLNMCKYNDYNTLNLLQIDNAIEALYDTFIAELKKKYTEEE